MHAYLFVRISSLLPPCTTDAAWYYAYTYIHTCIYIYIYKRVCARIHLRIEDRSANMVASVYISPMHGLSVHLTNAWPQCTSPIHKHERAFINTYARTYIHGQSSRKLPTNVHMHTHTHTYTYIHTHTHALTHTYIHIHTDIQGHSASQVRIPTHINTNVCMYHIYRRMHAHTPRTA